MVIVQSEEIVSLIYDHLSKLNEENKLNMIISWFKLLYEVSGSIFKTSSSSWMGSNIQGVKEVAYIFDKIIMSIFSNESLYKKLIKYLSENPYDIQSWKLSSSGFLSLFSWSSDLKKCDWTTPLHLLNRKHSSLAYLGLAIIESDAIKMEKLYDDINNELFSQPNVTNLELIIKVNTKLKNKKLTFNNIFNFRQSVPSTMLIKFQVVIYQYLHGHHTYLTFQLTMTWNR